MKLWAICGFLFLCLLCLNVFSAEGFSITLEKNFRNSARAVEDFLKCLQERKGNLPREDRRWPYQ